MFKGSFDEFAAVPVAVADDNNVRAYLNNPTRQNSLASQDVFKKLIQKDTTNRLVQLLNASKQVVLSSGGKVSSLRVNIDSLASPSMAKGVNFNVGKLVVLNGSMYFPAVARVTDSNKVIGYVVNWKVMKATPQAVDQLAQLLGANGRLYFGNDDGQFWTDLVKPVEKPPVEIAKLQGVARYSRKTSGAVIASVRKIPDSRWMMVVELSGASFHETASIFLRWMTALGIVLILIGSIGGWLMSRSITGPLKQLSGAAAAIAEGDYSKHVNIDREDELGMLADSFNIMSARVYAAQRELEQMVEERTRDLQTAITDIKDQKETDRKKDEFISIASHELKTPLTTLKAFFQLAGREMQPQLKSYNFFGNASRQLNRMERLITDLLDVSKINSGKMQYNFEEFDIERLLKDTIESAQQISLNDRYRLM
jgi:signal transduction histidine kinase